MESTREPKKTGSASTSKEEVASKQMPSRQQAGDKESGGSVTAAAPGNDGDATARKDGLEDTTSSVDLPERLQADAAGQVPATSDERRLHSVAVPDPQVVASDGELSDQRPEWQMSPSMMEIDDPLMTCLSILAGLLQHPISVEALKAGLPQDNKKFTPALCVRAAEQAGFKARVLRRPELHSILPISLPCILLLKGGNACLLLRILENAQAEVALPEAGAGTKIIDLAEIEEQYTGYAVFARPDLKLDARAPTLRVSEEPSWFWGTLFKSWRIYSHVILASVLTNSFALAIPLFIRNVYDRVVPNNALETLWVLALGVGIVFVFEFLVRNLRSYFVDIAGKNADVLIASDLLARVLAMRLDKKPPSAGALANNLREFELLRDFFTSGTLVVLVDLPFIFLFIGVIWLIAGPLALIPLVAVPIVIGVGVVLQKPLGRIVEKIHRESAHKHAILIEAIEGLETIKAATGEGRVQRQWERFTEQAAESSRKARVFSTLSISFAQVAVQVVTVGVVIYGVYLIAEGNLTVGGLIASTILTSRALAPLGAIAALVIRFQQSRVALKSLDSLMKTEVENAGPQEALYRPGLKGQIEFNKVTFSYPGQEGKALDEMSFRIAAGEKVGIIGRSGSGKSTIGRLILGLYQPSSGSILLDGTNIQQLAPRDLRRNIGYASQDNYLFFGSVRENICFGAPGIDNQAVLAAADIAGVTGFVQTHPHGFDLQVGERGMGLSGGQRQAVANARALLFDPPALVLDEPTSHMDNSNEARFKQKLSRNMAGKTLVLITHRNSLLTLVDRLIVIDSGKIVADGPRDKVIEALKNRGIRGAGEK